MRIYVHKEEILQIKYGIPSTNQSWDVSDSVENDKAASNAITWYKNRFNQVLSEIESSFKDYRLSEALMSIYKLIWDDFSSWLLESVKPGFGQAISKELYRSHKLFENNLRLHPFAIFDRKIWQHISERSVESSYYCKLSRAVAFDKGVGENGSFQRNDRWNKND